MTAYKLTNETIDLISEKIGEIYSSLECSKKEILRAKLLMEEALIKYKTRFGEDINVYFKSYKILSQTRISVRIASPSFDPFTLEENPMAFMINSIVNSFEGTMPTWKYHNLENEVVFTINKKIKVNALVQLGISVISAIILGIIAKLVFPSGALASFVSGYIDPLSNAYAGLFCVMASLMPLFAISLSIVHIGDLSIIGNLGGFIMKRFYAMAILIVAVLSIPVVPFFKFTGQTAISLAVKTVYDLFVSFIPTNFVQPFLSFNSVHIMIVGAMFGFSLLSMGAKGDNLVNVFEEFNTVTVKTNSFLNKFIFIYVSLKTFNIITTSDFKLLASTGKMLIVIVLGEALAFVFYLFRASKKCGQTPKEYFEKMMPPIFVCLSSGNIGASISTICDSLFAQGASEDMVSIALNMGCICFQPTATFVFIISALFMAKMYAIEISIVWLLLAFVLSILLVAAMPNIPGATVGVFTLLYAQLGLPAEALSLMIAVNAVLQSITVAVDAWCLEGEILCMDRDAKVKFKDMIE